MRPRQFWTEGPGSFLTAIGLALVVRWAVVEAYVIPSSNMVPSLLANDHIFVNKITFGIRVPFSEIWLARFSSPQRGEVVVFKHPADRRLFSVKRVVGLPGDRIYYENGNLYVNDQLVERTIPKELAGDWAWVKDRDFPGEAGQGGKANYGHWQETLDGRSYSVVLRRQEPQTLSFGPFTVPPDKYFVMGDNRDNSQDSRGWDPEAARAEGEVEFRLTTASGRVKIPAGTLVRTEHPGAWSQSFRTLAEVDLDTAGKTVRVRAIEAGPLGNVPAETIRVVEGPLADKVAVLNRQPLSGGEDKRFVPRDLLVGKATRVWLSCEKKLPVLTFLCNPLHIRWGRFFHPIR